MDDSQNSDILSESMDIFYSRLNAESTNIDIASYNSLVSNTKSSFSVTQKEINKPVFSGHFCSLLENCSMCITQSLELITDILSETDINVDQIKQYMNDAICILQLLSDFIKHVIECVSISCCSVKQFPIITGNIIMTIFTHCKDSESMYGSQLSNVEKQIKDLFKSCHELQITYLLVLEKHYIFNLTNQEEQNILSEALQLNLKIGEIVQSLDVKTMAEQWKAYTVICEKYSDNLLDKQIHRDCTNVLCAMISTNVKIALEENQEKLILRSLKVSSFTLKILLRICITFKQATAKDYSNVLELLLYVYLNNEPHLEAICGKNTNFIDMYNTNIMTPVINLISELLHDEIFLKTIYDYNIEIIKKDDKLLGFINLIISLMRCILCKEDDTSVKLHKHKIVNIIYCILPFGHTWFNMGLKYKCKESELFQTNGLYECLLTHTVALISTMITQEFHIVEKRMLEAILGTDCLSAIFTANIWTLIARTSSRQLLQSQVICLCKIYQKLEENTQFIDSPQKIHLSRTINKLFQLMTNEDKIKIYNMFKIQDSKNIGLWKCLKIVNLPNEELFDAEEFAMKQYQMEVQRLMDGNVDVDILIKSINLASTCSPSHNENIEICLINAWSKACPKNITCCLTQLDKGMLWYYKYIEALVALTESMEFIFHKSVNLVKVLHVVSNIICAGCTELKILLINILCKLANFEINNANKHFAYMIFTRTFQELFICKDLIVRNKLFDAFRIYKSNNLYRLMSNVVSKDERLKRNWTYFVQEQYRSDDINLKERLQSVLDMKYTHKCIENGELKTDLVSQRCLSNNFDMDILFENDSDEEPACKKTKLNTNETEEIITEIERNTSLLCDVEENVFTLDTKNRIRSVCNKLNDLLN